MGLKETRGSPLRSWVGLHQANRTTLVGAESLVAAFPIIRFIAPASTQALGQYCNFRVLSIRLARGTRRELYNLYRLHEL